MVVRTVGDSLFIHTNLGSNSLVRRKLRMGAKTVGSLSMKICGKRGQGMDKAKSGREWVSCPSSYRSPPFQLLPYSLRQSHLSESRCVRSEDYRKRKQSRYHGPKEVKC
jgi:hypothetical protein